MKGNKKDSDDIKFLTEILMWFIGILIQILLFLLGNN